ncbi:hypothetical protein NDS46_05250 [Paenibacillus thiaminolyticus]|uniref:hypothetical protein n=1 Tax=Paenibacillus thiaminolyticus TaxID=49283 RepID=UPI00232D3A51|nr:hypothetical protein [Paenibacillus thiaminolyticus]WCF09308.1 hypothetical protein NDS46_05250 [Paenibacillus thiaminolyticus]
MSNHNKDRQGLVKYYQFTEQTLVGSVNPGVSPPVIPTPIMGVNSLPTPTNVIPLPVGGITLKRIRSKDRIELIASVDWGFVASASLSNPFLSLVDFEQTVLLSIIRNDGKVVYQTADTAHALLAVSPSTSTTLTSSQIFRTTTFQCDDTHVITCDHKAVYTLTIQALTPSITLTSSTNAAPIVDFLQTNFSVFAFNFNGKVIDENPRKYRHQG